MRIPTCAVTPQVFRSFFVSGIVTLNGAVKPADSVNFPNTPNCSFYQWSFQMFLWLTSPDPIPGGGGGRVFDGPQFFDVSPLENKQRTLLPHIPGVTRSLSVRAAQVGANGLPVVFDKAGRLMQIAQPQLGPMVSR